jgi:hypothetical protein
MQYEQLYNNIQAYAENYEPLFVASIPTFIQEAETRIYNSVNLPSLRKNVTGNFTASNAYLSLPSDWLANYSLAVIDSTGNYNYLLNKDVNFLREAYPSSSTTGLPRYYALFGSNISNINNLSVIVGPTPDQNYSVEMHYFYYPPTIVQGQITTTTITSGGSNYTKGVYQNVALTGGSGANAVADILVVGGAVTQVTITNGGNFYAVGDVLSCSSIAGASGAGFSLTVTAISNSTGTSWLGQNYDPVLFYGAMREAILFMKGEQDLVKYYEDKFQEAMGELKRLCDSMERGDAYRDGQTKLNSNLKGNI